MHLVYSSYFALLDYSGQLCITVNKKRNKRLTSLKGVNAIFMLTGQDYYSPAEHLLA